MTDSVPPPPPEGPPLLPPPLATLHLHARAVPWRHAFAWFEEGMRLFRRAPATWIGLGFCTIAAELATTALPEVGPILAQIVSPLVAGGLAFAAAAADRGNAPSLKHAVAAFGAPIRAMVAIVAANLVAFAGEALAAWFVADVNLLAPGDGNELSTPAIVGMVALGILSSLPVAFVPFHALLERAPPAEAFRASFAAFGLNTLPLLAYAAAALVLVGLGAATMGLGLLLALPLLATAGYAAWKDIFGVRDAPG